MSTISPKGVGKDSSIPLEEFRSSPIFTNGIREDRGRMDLVGGLSASQGKRIPVRRKRPSWARREEGGRELSDSLLGFNVFPSKGVMEIVAYPFEDLTHSPSKGWGRDAAYSI